MLQGGEKPDQPGAEPNLACRKPELLTLLTILECRHIFASILIDTEANPKAIQEVMEHSKIQTTYDVCMGTCCLSAMTTSEHGWTPT